MALYKNSNYLIASKDAAFDQINNPGASTRWSGVYKCEGCGKEITSIVGNTLPPQNHHQHTLYQGTIRWKLAVTHNS